MNRANLGVYLNDHLAGAAGAITHLDHLVASCGDKQLEAFLRSLHAEIEADQNILKKLIKDIGEKESGVRKAGAWVAEKLSRVKLGASETDEGMGLFLSFEALVLGITGKERLWAALAAAAEKVPELRGPDYATLEVRAGAQVNRVEVKRLELARIVFKTERASGIVKAAAPRDAPA